MIRDERTDGSGMNGGWADDDTDWYARVTPS